MTFSTLTLSDVTFTDRGEFICTAENEHNTISSNASLVVYGKSKLYAKSPEFSIFTKMFSCRGSVL